MDKINIDDKVCMMDGRTGIVTFEDKKNKKFVVVVKTQGLFEVIWRPAEELEVVK